MKLTINNIRVGHRKRLALASLATAVSLLVGIAIPQAGAAGLYPSKPKGTELNLYNWSNYIDPALLKRFTEETGINVNLGVYDSNAQMLAKLEAGARGYDISYQLITWFRLCRRRACYNAFTALHIQTVRI